MREILKPIETSLAVSWADIHEKTLPIKLRTSQHGVRHCLKNERGHFSFIFRVIHPYESLKEANGDDYEQGEEAIDS